LRKEKENSERFTILRFDTASYSKMIGIKRFIRYKQGDTINFSIIHADILPEYSYILQHVRRPKIAHTLLYIIQSGTKQLNRLNKYLFSHNFILFSTPSQNQHSILHTLH